MNPSLALIAWTTHAVLFPDKRENYPTEGTFAEVTQRLRLTTKLRSFFSSLI